MRMSVEVEVCCAWRRSAERVSSAMRPSARDDEALEEAEAERVVAGEPVHRFLLEEQQAVEPGLRHGGEEGGLAAVELGGGKVQGHEFPGVSWPG